MKKANIYFGNGYYWNKWVRKFFRLFRKMERLQSTPDCSPFEKKRIDSQLNSVYRRLCRMQSKVGIKIAGSAIALIMATTTLNAQTFVDHGMIYNQTQTIIPTDYNASAEFADIDNDGDLDLFFGDGAGYIHVFSNDGAGNFLQEANLGSGGSDIHVGSYTVPVFEDLDGDLDLDLFIGSSAGTIAVYTNDGSGVFTAAGNLQAGGADILIATYSTLDFADLDNDGDLDVYVGNYYTGTLSVFTNDGTGVFTAAGLLQANGADIAVSNFPNPAFADIDGDGDMDLYLGERSYGHIRVYENNGSGVLSSAGYLQADGDTIEFNQYSLPEFADVDGDGDLDLYVGTWDSGIHVFENDGSGNFAYKSKMKYVTPALQDIYSTIAFADIDTDGDLDLYVGGYNGNIFEYINAGNGEFFPGALLQGNSVNIDVGYVSVPVFADIDNDNDLDLFVAAYDGTVSKFINYNGTFSAPSQMQADAALLDVGSWASVALADIDTDGDLDLYVGEIYGRIRQYTNNGLGVFNAAGNVQAGGADLMVPYVSRPLFADFDEDGDVDLLVGDYFGGVTFFANDGSGNFAAGVPIQSNGQNINVIYLASPGLANFDGGCRPDLYVGGYSGYVYHYNYSDTTAPVVTCPGSLDETLFESQPYWTVAGSSFDPVSYSDNCSISDVFNSYNGGMTLAGATFTSGFETVVWTIVDEEGNTATCAFNVTINIYDAITDLEQIGVVMYPNPTDGEFTLENILSCDVQISDLTGKIIRNFTSIPDQKVVIDLSDQKPGIYFIRVTNNNESVTSRLVIE